MERQDYPAMLPQLQPNQAVDVLNDRVRQVGKLNTAIADWLQERRRLEEQYSSGLRRLARKQLEDIDLGIFSVPWETLTQAAATVADSHSNLATKIEVDVEQPLRAFVSTNREMQAMTTIQGNLAAMAKDVEKARQKVEKAAAKGDGRVATASTELDNAQTQWESQAPYVFENLQAVDETRLNLLRDALTQFQTHEVDMVERGKSTVEHCLNVLLSIQTEDEIKTFALKAVQARPRQERARGPSIPAAPPTPSRGMTSSSNLTPTMSQPDDESTRSSSVQEDKKKSRFGGLKRLGTVVGGKSKRESKMPSQLAPMAESPERKSKSSPFNSFGGRFGKNKGATQLEPPSEESPMRERPRSPLRMGSEMLEPPAAREEAASSPRSFEPPQQQQQTNGVSAFGAAAPAMIPNGSHQGDLADLDPPKPSQPEPAPSAPEVQRDSEGYSLPPPDARSLDPISQAQADAAAEGAGPAFNVNIRNAPIQEEGTDSAAALQSMAGKLSLPPMVASKVGTVRGRRQRPVSTIGAMQSSDSIEPVASTSSFPNPPPALDPVATEESRQIAAPDAPAPARSITSGTFGGAASNFSPFASTASQSTPQPQPAAIKPAAAEQSREVVSPTAEAVQSPSAAPITPSASGTFGAAGAAGGFSPFASTMSQFRPQSAADHTADSGSIRSGRSLTSTTSQAIRHPDLHDTGLNSSIVETVGARFENGKLTNSSLVGEIALAYNPADFSSPFGTENIRLENFGALEKVAPNPAFLTQTPGKEGEYAVDLKQIGKTQVAFKYQMRADDSGALAPLMVAPAFKIESTQASVIVSYSLNPSFNLHGRGSVTLTNVMLGLTLEGAKATGCQSKPVGTFSREKNLIFWQLGDVTLTPGAPPQKLLARFATESEAKTGSVEAKWEISSSSNEALGSGLAVSMQAQQAGAGDGADPFADEGLTAVWKGVAGVRKLTAGAYFAK